MRLGGPTFFQSEDPREMARAHRKLGYRGAYAPNFDINDTARINEIIKAYAEEDVVIAEVGAWSNMMDLDLKRREETINNIIDRLAHAEAIGARTCVNIAGSFNPTNWAGPHPDNYAREAFDLTVTNCRKIIDAVKPKRTTFSIEMMQWTVPDTVDCYAELILAVDRKAFAVHCDPTNLINSPPLYYNTGKVIREVFERLGDKIASCHAKDVILSDDSHVHLTEIMPGRGNLDYATYLKCLNALPHDPPLLVEHLRTAEEYAEAAGYIRGVADECGLSFEA